MLKRSYGFELRMKELFSEGEKVIFQALGYSGGDGVADFIAGLDPEQAQVIINYVRIWSDTKKTSIKMAKSYDSLIETVCDMRDDLEQLKKQNERLGEENREILRKCERAQEELKKISKEADK